ncbi:MAG TPA: response regulator transcription factor [Tepidisphaeraceae bacterium]|jgi:DNA-binding response OmpR family regulator|nr:response regulator transcription factor [Tepidisphaeraceae bacterium]
MKRRTILVIDDQKDFREIVRRALEQHDFDVILASDGTSGLRIAEEHRPDLLVLDLTMRDMDGLEVCRRLRENPRHRLLPILVISARASAPERILGLQTGADDYLIKPFDPEELIARVNALLRRAVNPADVAAVIKSGDLQIDLNRHQVTVNKNPVRLTPAEFRILEFLAAHAGHVFSRDEIIESCLGETENGEVIERTVDTHIVGIRKALGEGSRYLQTVRTIGYKFAPEP